MWRLAHVKNVWDMYNWIELLQWWTYNDKIKVKARCHCWEIYYPRFANLTQGKSKSCWCWSPVWREIIVEYKWESHSKSEWKRILGLT
jgi:hypothetical protein